MNNSERPMSNLNRRVHAHVVEPYNAKLTTRATDADAESQRNDRDKGSNAEVHEKAWKGIRRIAGTGRGRGRGSVPSANLQITDARSVA